MLQCFCLLLYHIHKKIQENQLMSRMILQVHDELIFDVPEVEIEQMKTIIHDGMTSAMKLHVPLTAECSVGHNWYEAK